MYDVAYIGYCCAMYRKLVLRVKQVEVAIDTGYKLSNVSCFERGKCKSLGLLLWYIDQGLDMKGVLKYGKQDEGNNWLHDSTSYENACFAINILYPEYTKGITMNL